MARGEQDGHRGQRPVEGPVVLCILDGVGLGAGGPDDAVALANTPTLDAMRAEGLFFSLKAHGTAVGLPTDGDMGNSEVGHNALGSGQVVDQGAKRVDVALRDGSAFEGPVWKQLTAGATLHLLGLLSDGNVHSHVDHLHLLLDQAVADGVRRIRVHLLTDGRDVSPRSALAWVTPLEARLAELRIQGVDVSVASGGGRMHLTMDRYEADWQMVARGWACHVRGEGQAFPSAVAAIEALYEANPEVDDQYLPAFVVVDEAGQPVGRIQDGDSVLLFNFRGDRALEISRAFTESDFTAFDRGPLPDLTYAGIMEYDGDEGIPPLFLVDPPTIDNTLGEQLVAMGLRSLAVSETQKFGHVTYFFNGNRSAPLHPTLDTWVCVPSDNRPFDEAPWMKAAEITDVVLEALQEGGYDHIRLNLANGDMVGHTGNLRATVMAVEAVDLQLARLWSAVKNVSGVLVVTADHGNADEMWMRAKGEVQRQANGRAVSRTSHTLAPVPCVLLGVPDTLRPVTDTQGAGLASVTGTLLRMLGGTVPDGWENPLLVAASTRA